MSFARWASVVVALAAFFAALPLALADEPAPKGLAVLATDGATDAAWPLAAAVYGDAALRPARIDDPTARVLAGEAAPDSSADLKSLAELRAGVKGDDAASRAVLAGIAKRLAVRAVVVVFAGTPPTARVFDASAGAFDAARYDPDPSSGAHPTWTSALRSLERPYVTRPAPKPAPKEPAAKTAPAAAVHAVPPARAEKSKAFYESPWFWAAIGAAALIGGGVLVATTVQSGDTIHLQMRLP
jgi:hypothetical protein